MPQLKSSAPNRVRIIGGKWKKSVITFPALEGLRPTPDRAALPMAIKAATDGHAVLAIGTIETPSVADHCELGDWR